MDIRVKGTTFENRQGFLAYLNKQTNLSGWLRREPNNKFDPNAIAVIAYAKDAGKVIKVGYIPKELAETIAPKMDDGKKIWVKKFAVTGGSGMNYGAVVTI